MPLETKGMRKPTLNIAGRIIEYKDKDRQSVELQYTPAGKPFIKFSLASNEAKKVNGEWVNGPTVWFNMEGWPTEDSLNDWMLKLKPGAAVVAVGAELSISEGKDGKVYSNWRMNMFNGLFIVAPPKTAVSSQSSSSNRKWADPDEESFTEEA